MVNKIIIVAFVISSFVSLPILAQKHLYNNAKISAIDANTIRFQKLKFDNDLFVKGLAQKLKIDIRRSLGGGRTMELKGANDIGEPIFTISESNLQAGQTTRTNSFYKGGKLGIDLTGSGITTYGRLGIWDGGKVLNTHVEFGNRVTQIDNATSTSSHSTHVAGTMIAEGVNALAKGMAPNASLKAWDYNNDDAEMSAASKELLVSNHSYGQVAGWVYNDSREGNQKWEWYGNIQINKYEDYKFGLYDSQSQGWDRIAYLAPNYLIVKSAGNKRNENGPGISKTDTTLTLEKYYLGSGQDSSFVARSRNDGFDNLPTYSVAKNILTVGAVSIIPNGPSLASDIKISSFSSWGPTDDGRIKPDIVGAGVNLFSTTDAGNSAYTFLSGTSMSSPQVAGSIFLLQELYAQQNNNKMMRSSTLKGLVLHTATDAGNAGPDYSYGWGLLDMEKAGNILLNKNKTHILEEKTLLQNDVYSKKIIANGKEPLVVTICWTDPEGQASSNNSGSFNNRTPKLVNDLDVSISDGKTNFLAWVLDPNNPSKLATKGDNIRDNVEQVFIANPIPGKEYTIKISHKSTLKNDSQEYAFIVSGGGGLAYCTSAPLAQEDTKIEKVTINNLSYTAQAGCTTYTDNTNLSLAISPNQKVDLDILTGTCGAQKDKAYSLFVDWNIDGDFDDVGEKVANSSALSSALTFQNTFNAPSAITPGGTTRLRLIVSESDNINTCGGFAKGETIDFTLNYINPKNDLSISELLFPDENICANTSVDVATILISNKGTNPINIGNINAIVYENGLKIYEQPTKIFQSINAQSNSRLSFPITVAFKENATYTFEISGIIANDENAENNTIKVVRTVNTDVLSENAKVIGCSNDKLVTLTSNGKGAAFWYDAPTGGNLLAIGNNVSYSKPAIPIQYYASQNDLNGVIGPISKKDFAGGSYSGNFGPKPFITTKAPIRLESARLYIGNAGKIIFTVERVSDLTPIASVTLDVLPTRDQKLGNATNGQQLDDPQDPGAVYNLGLDIPEAGSYQIAIEYEDGASIFRSNQGVTGFPFSLQNNTVKINGSSFNGTTLTAAWYYFYNLKIKSLGCPSPIRTLAQSSNALSAVAKIAANSITDLCPNKNVTLTADLGQNLKYQWFKDSLAITDAIKNEILVTQKGKYYAEISDGGVCPSTSNVITVVIKAPQAPSISSEANVLTASESQAYQWLLDRKAISGATAKIYTAYQTGSYSVLSKIDGCDLQSFEIFVTILADETIQNDAPPIVFPNPTFQEINITGTEFSKDKALNYTLFDANGKNIKTDTLKNFDKNIPQKIDLLDLPAGQYLLLITIGEKRFLKKITKL
jgi:Subtilase family/GEVED domain/Secretion system C-terminal sorting domain